MSSDSGIQYSGVSGDLVRQFEASLNRCLQKPTFVEEFYRRFMASDERVQAKFASTDLARQYQVLETSLKLMARAALGREEGQQHLEAIAHRHSQRRLDIGPSLYALWLDALIDTAGNYDPEFSVEVAHAWREVLGSCAQRMVACYRTTQTIPPRGASRAGGMND